MDVLYGNCIITEYLKTKDPSLIEIDEPTNPNYKCFNTGGVETVVGEFLYGLVRMIRPENVLETGTHMGISSSYIAQGLKDNGGGLLTTIELNASHIETSRARWKKLDVDSFVVCDHSDSLEYDLEDDFDIMFLDSEPYLRFKELRRYYPRLKQGGYVFIHDTPRNYCQGNVNSDHPDFKDWPFGPINKEVKDWVRDRELIPFHFGTPRGLSGFYKIHPEDYRWDRV